MRQNETLLQVYASPHNTTDTPAPPKPAAPLITLRAIFTPHKKFMASHLEQAPRSPGRPLEIELIRSVASGSATAAQKKLYNQLPEGDYTDPNHAFIIKPAAEWMKAAPHTSQNEIKLFGDFWYRGELCIFFADTNTGKSILAVQLADSLSRGVPIAGFDSYAPAAPVLYFDFELSTAQFARRYRDAAQTEYRFHPNFYRVVLNPEATGARKFKTYAEYINNAIENLLVDTGAQTVIIDNLTCLRTGTETAATAINLMRGLQAIKTRYNLSILALAHTPKRNPAKPLSRNDLQGSKMLMNFADSAFAMGESHTTPGLRYLKQIKQRSAAEVHGADNVCLFRLSKAGNFLQLDFAGTDTEAVHLLPYTEQQRRETEERIIQAHSRGNSLRKIAMQTGLSHNTVHRVVKRWEKEQG